MADADAFGHARRAGGVDDIGELIGMNGLLPAFGALGIHLGDQHHVETG